MVEHRAVAPGVAGSSPVGLPVDQGYSYIETSFCSYIPARNASAFLVELIGHSFNSSSKAFLSMTDPLFICYLFICYLYNFVQAVYKAP